MANRSATLLLQLGIIVVVVAALPYKLFELDRYFVPKELVLNVVALVCALLIAARGRLATIDAADVLLAAFLGWSLASALFATNHWVAQRALGVSVSGAAVFWMTRRIGASGAEAHRTILLAAAGATVLAAVTGLAQAYGLETDYFSLNRAPGGTFGNRNFVAHVCAIGLPAIAYCAVTARRSMLALAWSLGVALVGGLLVLTRSRAAWLAVAASLALCAIPFMASRKYWTGRGVGGRVARLALAAVVGAALAMVVPNQLNWSSDSPYLDSARGMVDYRTGSGRGRVAQYTNSLRMAAAHPVFGVGPGNWPVQYPRYAPGDDASLTDDGMTANPWPSSDWAAFISERGVAAAVMLLGVFVVLTYGASRRWADLPGGDAVLVKVALIGTVAATLVVGLFDVSLMLAAPSFLAWSVIGAASGTGQGARKMTPPRRAWAVASGLVLLVTLLSVARSAGQTMAIVAAAEGGTRDGWLRAAVFDPGSYRIALRVAQIYASRGRCASARQHARRARSLFPNADAPGQILRRCGGH